MNVVTAEIAQEGAVLLQHDDIDAAARQQKTEHHPGRPAAGNTALRGDRILSHGDTARFGESDAEILALCDSWSPSQKTGRDSPLFTHYALHTPAAPPSARG